MLTFQKQSDDKPFGFVCFPPKLFETNPPYQTTTSHHQQRGTTTCWGEIPQHWGSSLPLESVGSSGIHTQMR